MADTEIRNDHQRVLFITQQDPFYIRVFFEEFLKSYPGISRILGVVICPTMAKRSLPKLVKQMYNFYGFRDFLRMALRYFMARIKRGTLKNLLRNHRVSVFKEPDINSDAFLDFCRRQEPDIIVSVAAPQVFREKLLSLPKWGCINIHHSKLPQYRGMMPNFWQMFYDEETAGITVHSINLRIDEGKIILQREIPIIKGESLDSLIKRSKRIGAHCVIEALDLIREDKVSYLPNNPEKGSYFSFPDRKDVLAFRRKCKKIL
ncbi:formyltransferase family protein [Candidatus Omnitrophota bacterium]